MTVIYLLHDKFLNRATVYCDLYMEKNLWKNYYVENNPKALMEYDISIYF